MKRLLVIFLPILLLLGFFLIWWNQPARVVERRLDGLLKAAEVSEGAGSLSKNLSGQSIEKYLAEHVTLDGPAEGEEEYSRRTYSRDELVSLYSGFANMAKRVSFKKPDDVIVDVSGDSATTTATLDASAVIGDKDLFQGAQRVTMSWIKTSDGWQLSKAAWTKAGK